MNFSYRVNLRYSGTMMDQSGKPVVIPTAGFTNVAMHFTPEVGTPSKMRLELYRSNHPDARDSLPYGVPEYLDASKMMLDEYASVSSKFLVATVTQGEESSDLIGTFSVELT